MENRCKIYKGIDTPCKIKGMLSNYFYMMFAVYGLAGLMVLLNLSSASQTGEYGEFLIEASLIGAGVLFVKIYFTKKSNIKKIKKSNQRIYASPRSIYKSLKRK